MEAEGEVKRLCKCCGKRRSPAEFRVIDNYRVSRVSKTCMKCEGKNTAPPLLRSKSASNHGGGSSWMCCQGKWIPRTQHCTKCGLSGPSSGMGPSRGRRR